MRFVPHIIVFVLYAALWLYVLFGAKAHLPGGPEPLVASVLHRSVGAFLNPTLVLAATLIGAFFRRSHVLLLAFLVAAGFLAGFVEVYPHPRIDLHMSTPEIAANILAALVVGLFVNLVMVWSMRRGFG